VHRVVLATLAALLLLGTTAAHARPVGAGHDGRPNILVVMTDDMAASDLAHMPNVQRLLVRQGTSFTGAVDSFPLCCPARATFITGQYAHNHGVGGNFSPYGWYGMADRRNILPAWLQQAGYHTAMVGKWLNGYGARDSHGEVPAGFDDWRGLLDASAYDYFNYVMNDNGSLRTWGDADFARKLVAFARVEVDPNPHPGLAAVLQQLIAVMGPAPYTYWGTADRDDYSPDVTGRIAQDLIASQAHAKRPFFVWWSPASPHREDVATSLMGRPGPDPRPAPRYAGAVDDLKAPRPPSFDEADLTDKPAALQQALPPLTDAQKTQLNLDYGGRIGSLRAVDDHVASLVATLKRTHQLANTLIVFVSDNGWLQGEHRVPGDKFLPYEESLRVPFVLRGPGVPKGRTISGQVANIDFAPTLVDAAHARAGRTMDGVSLLPVARHPRTRPDRAIEIEALDRLFQGDFPIMFNGWDRPYRGVRTDRWTYVVWTETGAQELYDRKRDPYELRNLAGTPADAAVQARLAAKLRALEHCKGPACRRVSADTPAPAASVTQRHMHDARYCELFELRGTPPNASATIWNTIGLNDCPQPAWDAIDTNALAQERGDVAVIRNGPRHFLMDRATAQVGSRHTFGGLAMTDVGALPIHSAADLVQGTYTDRTVQRDNTWTWDRGRTVFELVAPGGDVYVMQSYAQIKDPGLTLAQLPRLGARLDLPPGWSYRTRVLRRPLTLGADGRATILQDELQNTYQLAHATRRPGPRHTRTIHITGATKSVPPVNLAGTITDRGTLTATPFGDGTIELTAHLADGMLQADVRMRFRGGSIHATAALTPTLSGNEVDFVGTGRIVGGTGAYRGITGATLQVHDHNTLDGQNGRLSVDGRATW
jgi:arylsulfatase A-like enzyme